jgi:hypothetical protein
MLERIPAGWSLAIRSWSQLSQRRRPSFAERNEGLGKRCCKSLKSFGSEKVDDSSELRVFKGLIAVCFRRFSLVGLFGKIAASTKSVFSASIKPTVRKKVGSFVLKARRIFPESGRAQELRRKPAARQSFDGPCQLNLNSFPIALISAGLMRRAWAIVTE